MLIFAETVFDMTHLIDVKKLIAKIVELRKELPDTIEHLNDEESGFARGQQYELTAIEAEILCLQQEQPETPSGEEVMTMCNQILIDWVKEGKTPEEREQREQAHIRFFELYDEYMQEQPEPTCKTCGFYENNCPFIRGKLIPYPNKVCKDYTYSAMKEQKSTAEEVLIRAGLKLFKDGNQWCVLVGDNIQEGVCGFGDTIEDALYEFLKEVCEQQKPAEWSEDDKTIDQLAEEYVEGVKKFNDAPTWDLIHTAVCYGYELSFIARKEE